MAERKVTLRVFDIDPGDSLLAESLEPHRAQEVKLRALEKLGITPRDGEDPLQAWLRSMCAENELEYSMPAPRALADAIVDSRAALRFIWFLSGGAR